MLRKELLEKAKNGEATREDAMTVMMLAMLSMEKKKKEEDANTEKDE